MPVKTPTGSRKARADAPNQAVLRHWIEAVPNDRLAHMVRDAARGLSRSLQLRLSQHALSFGHWTFLRVLWEGDGLTQSELAAAVGVMEPTAYNALKTMEGLGYVARRKLPGNNKKVHIYLTPQGQALKAKLVPLAEDVNEIAVAGIDPADIAATRRTLLAIIVNLARDEADAEGSRMRIPSTREVARARAASASLRRRGAAE